MTYNLKACSQCDCLFGYNGHSPDRFDMADQDVIITKTDLIRQVRLHF